MFQDEINKINKQCLVEIQEFLKSSEYSDETKILLILSKCKKTNMAVTERAYEIAGSTTPVLD